MKRKQLILAGVVVAGLAAAALGFFWPFGNGADVLRYPGTVEIQEVRLGSKVGGRVKEVLVTEGQEVNGGDVLVVFDVPELEAQRGQFQAKVAAARAELAKAEYGPRKEEKDAARAAADAALARFTRMFVGFREEEKDQAKSDLATADADLKKAEEDLVRVAQLYQQRGASRAEYDAALGARDAARGRVNAARARYAMMVAGYRWEEIAESFAEWEKAAAKQEELDAGTRPEDIDLAKAQLAEVEAKLREINVNIEERNVTIPAKLGRAVVQVLAVRPGDLVPAGQPVVRVLRAEEQWVVFYVPEPELGKIEKGAKVEVTIDTYRRTFPGTVDVINPVAEFTPRNIQTREERGNQVFGVKVKIDRDQSVFHAGMAAEVLVSVKRQP